MLCRHNRTCCMRIVHPQYGTDLIYDAPEGFVVKVARVGARTDRDHFRPDFQRAVAHAVDVDAAGKRAVALHAVVLGFVKESAEVDLADVREVPPVRHVKTQKSITGIMPRT